MMKTYDIWTEGYADNGGWGEATYMGSAEGLDFNDAVANFVETQSAENKSYWDFEYGTWSYWGCRAFGDEGSAREMFG